MFVFGEFKLTADFGLRFYSIIPTYAVCLLSRFTVVIE